MTPKLATIRDKLRVEYYRGHNAEEIPIKARFGFEDGFNAAIKELWTLVETVEFYAKENDIKGCFKSREITTDLRQTTAAFHKELNDDNCMMTSTRWSLTGRGQIDHGKKAREALERIKE